MCNCFFCSLKNLVILDLLRAINLNCDASYLLYQGGNWLHNNEMPDYIHYSCEDKNSISSLSRKTFKVNTSVICLVYQYTV